jgi:transglutaminase-like putative cysteine protease
MNRRSFLASSSALLAAPSFPLNVSASTAWRSYETVTRVEIQWPKGVTKAWIPLPLVEDNEWHKTIGNSWSGNASIMQPWSDGKYGLSLLYAEWRDNRANPVAEVTSRFSTRERTVDLSKPAGVPDLSKDDREFYTRPTELIPTDGIVRKTALQATKAARTEMEKARALYGWVVDNTFRDPKTRGCGWGDIKQMLETGNLGGKCGDLNALFVGLSRSIGLPARDTYGLRVARSEYGYASLGVGSPNVTRAQHCRAEFFARGHGWVPVDPADVRKVVLEEPPGNLPVTSEKVQAARSRLFGSWEMNWLAYNRGHDIKLPNASGPKLPYLMYVNAETGGEMLDQLDPDAIKYTITARPISTV